jgi:hypothetical protein
MKKKQKEIVKAIFDNLDQLTKEDIISSQMFKDVLKIHVPKAIEEAIVNKKTFATVFEINSTSSFVDIHKNYWADSLSVCLNWHLEDESEDYETCSHISKMIESLKTNKK